MKKIFILIGLLLAFASVESQDFPDYHYEGVVIGSFTSDPATGKEGQIYWNSTDKKFRKHNGTEWSDLVSGGALGLQGTTDIDNTTTNDINISGNNNARLSVADNINFRYAYYNADRLYFLRDSHNMVIQSPTLTDNNIFSLRDGDVDLTGGSDGDVLTVQADGSAEFESIGMASSQDNIYKYLDVSSADFNRESIATAINLLPSFTIDEDEVVFFKVAITDDPESGYLIATLKDLGKGDYGATNTALTSDDIGIISSIPFSIYDILLQAETQFIDLSDIGVSTIEDGFNAHTFTGLEDPVQSQDDGYVVIDVVQDGTTYQYLFIGDGGDYGTGGTDTATEEDFILISSEIKPNSVWKDRFGVLVANSYSEWISHDGSVNVGSDLHVEGYINGTDGNGSSKVKIRGGYGAEFSGGNTNHATYVFNTEAPSAVYAGGRGFDNVVLSRDYSFQPGNGEIQTNSFRISPTVDFTNTTSSVSEHRSIYINPTITNLNGGTNYSILSQSGDVEFNSGNLKLGDYGLGSITGTLAYSLGVDADGNAIEYSPSDDIPLSGTEVGSPVTGPIEFTGGVIVDEEYSFFLDSGTSTQFIGFDSDTEGVSSGYTDSSGNLTLITATQKVASLVAQSNSDNKLASINVDSSQGAIVVSARTSTAIAPLTGSRGIISAHDYTPNITDLDFVQKKYVDDEITAASLGGGTDDQTADEVTTDDASYDVIGSDGTVQDDLIDIDNELYSSKPVETTDTGTEISLHTSGGNNCNFGTANDEEAYTIASSPVLNGWAQVLINTDDEPSITGATQEGGIEWVADTDLYMVVRNNGTEGVVYYYLPTTVATSGGGSGDLLASNNLSDLDDAVASLVNLDLTATATEINTLDGITATTTELNYTDGVTSNIQDQIDDVNTAITRVGFAAKSSNTTVPATTFTTAVFSVEIDDLNSAWDGTTFTVPAGEGGMYEIYGHATFDNVSDGNIAIVGVEINSSLPDGGLLGRGTAGATGRGGYGGALRLNLSAGDTVELVVYCQNSTTLLNTGGQEGYCTFSAYKM